MNTCNAAFGLVTNLKMKRAADNAARVLYYDRGVIKTILSDHHYVPQFGTETIVSVKVVFPSSDDWYASFYINGEIVATMPINRSEKKYYLCLYNAVAAVFFRKCKYLTLLFLHQLNLFCTEPRNMNFAQVNVRSSPVHHFVNPTI